MKKQNLVSLLQIYDREVPKLRSSEASELKKLVEGGANPISNNLILHIFWLKKKDSKNRDQRAQSSDAFKALYNDVLNSE